MTARMDQFQAINSNPALSLAKDGTVLYSNEAGEPLLHEWGVRVGEKLPPHIEVFVQRAISREGIEKIEVKMGKRVYFFVFQLLPEKECINIYGFDITDQKELEVIFWESETQEKTNLELANIIDVKTVQSLMNDFYRLAHIPMALFDLKGNILVSVGWQEICIKFHRVNPEACKHCVESDINLSTGIAPGGYKLCRCKNGMWDIATPVVADGQHVGNIFSGQFFFEGEPLDYELFRSQARKYGFNEEKYITALEKVPRLSREALNTAMSFLMTFANMVSQLGYSNLKLVKSLTERDTLVEELKKSYERFSSVLENSLDSAYRLDLQSNCFDYMSPVIEQITGFFAKEIDAMSVNDFLDHIHPDDRPIVISGSAQAFDEGFGAQEYRFKCKDGKYRWLADHFSIVKDKTGMTRFRAGIVRDITERKRAEEELRENYCRLNQAQEFLEAVTKGTDVIIASVDMNFCYTYFNKAYREEIKRLSGKEIHIGASMIEMFAHLPDQQKIFIEQWSDVLEGKSTNKMMAFGDPGPYQRIYEILRTPIRDAEGKIVGAGEVGYDVTEKVSAEAALRESEERFRALVTASSEMVYRVSPDWSEMRQLYGRGFLADTESPSSAWLQEYVPPEDQGHVMAIINEAIRTKSTYELEHRVRRANGNLGWVFSRAVPMLDAKGEIVEWFGAASDITERKKVEEALRESEERLRLLSDNLPDSAVYQYAHELGGSVRFLYISAGVERLNGIKVSDVLRDPGTLHRQIPPDYFEKFVETEARSARELSDFDMEIPMLRPDGQVRWMRVHSHPRRLPDGRTIWDGVQIDVTKQKKVEEDLKKVHDNLEKLVKERTTELENAYESLKESEEGLAEAQKMAHIGNWVWDLVTDKTYWSAEIYHILGLNPQESGAIHHEFLDYVHPDDRDYVDNAIKKAIDEKPFGIDYRIITASGEERTVHAESEVTLDPDKIPIRAKGIIQDITERKEVEEALANLEIARKKEIHHRIKNNLQVISSLLDLQADKFDNLKVIEAFRESQNRVISMALIHEELYKGEGNDTLDFSSYLKKLAKNLFKTYNLSGKNISLSTDLEEDTFLDMDTAVPLGIIVNELVSNSLKHAFIEEEGEIRIKLCREERNYDTNESLFSLAISDNGKGMPEDLELESAESLGLQLVNILVDQLDGELELKRAQGTEFIIRFKVTEKDNPAQVGLKSQENE